MKGLYKIGGIVVFFILIITVLPLAIGDLDLTHEVEKHTYLNKAYIDDMNNNEYLYYEVSPHPIYENYSISFWFESDFQLEDYDSFGSGLINIIDILASDDFKLTYRYNYIGDPFSDDFQLRINYNDTSRTVGIGEDNTITNEKIHTTLTKSDKNYSFYMDGDLIDTLEFKNPPKNVSINLGYSSLDGSNTDTYYSELYFFNRTLNESEINDNMGSWDNSTFENYTYGFNLWNKTLYESGTIKLYEYENKNGEIIGDIKVLSNEVYKERRVIDSWTVFEQHNLMKNVLLITLILLSIAIILKIGRFV